MNVVAIMLLGLARAAGAQTPAPLSVWIHAPSSGAFVAGQLAVSVAATGPVAGIQLKLDGADLGLPGAVSPHLVSWNTAEAFDGPHSLAAVAWDSTGVSTSAVVPINVQNAPPFIGAVSTGFIGMTYAHVLWFTTQPADSQADYGTSTAYGASSVREHVLVSTHTASLIGLTPNTLYHYRVKSTNASGVQAFSGDITFTTAASPNPDAPVVASALRAGTLRRFLTPTRGDAVFGPDAREVTVFDLRGRRIFHAVRAGGSPLIWDSKDGMGRTVESGVYIARIKTLAGTVYQSLAVVK